MTNRQELIEEIAATIAAAELVGGKVWADLFEIQKKQYRALAEKILTVVDKDEDPWVVDPWFLDSMPGDYTFVGDPPMVPESVAKYLRTSHSRESLRLTLAVESRPDIMEALRLANEAADRGEVVKKRRRNND